MFGFLYITNILSPHKLSPRFTPCVFLGYPTNHKGYHCLRLHKQKIIIYRHVVFHETVFPYGCMTPNSSPSYSFLEHVSLPIPTIPSPYPTPTKDIHHVPTPPSIDSDVVSHGTPPYYDSDTSNPSFSTAVSSFDSQYVPRSHNSISASTPITIPLLTQFHYPILTRAKHSIVKPAHKPSLHIDFTSLVPKTYLQEFKDPNWINKITEEYSALISNRTWVLVPHPPPPQMRMLLIVFGYLKRNLMQMDLSPNTRPA